MKRLILLLTFLITTASFAEDFAVIVNASNDSDDIRSHFLLIDEKWENGAKTVAFEVNPKGNTKKSKVQKVFLDKILGMTVQGYRKHWTDRKAAGKTIKPRMVNSYRAVKKYVQRKKGGIGYVPKRLAGGNVKIIKTFKVK